MNHASHLCCNKIFTVGLQIIRCHGPEYTGVLQFAFANSPVWKKWTPFRQTCQLTYLQPGLTVTLTSMSADVCDTPEQESWVNWWAVGCGMCCLPSSLPLEVHVYVCMRDVSVYVLLAEMLVLHPLSLTFFKPSRQRALLILHLSPL